MKIGSKIPIATGSYQTGAATALVSSLVNTQFQYHGRGREYRDDADRPLRPRCDAEDQDRGYLAERLGDHQRRDRADPRASAWWTR